MTRPPDTWARVGRAGSGHPARHLLGQANLLLRAAHAIQTGRHRRGRPLRLDRAQRGRLAACLAGIAGLVQVHASPGNLPTGHRLDPHLHGRMDHATIRLRQAATLLETLAGRAEPGHAHIVLTAVADAAEVMDAAWALTQRVGGYHDRRQVDRAAAQLGHVVASLADIAAAVAEHEQQLRWKPAAGLLATACHAVHHIHTHLVDRP